MAIKIEEVIYCDSCEKRVERSFVGLLCEKPRVSASPATHVEVDDERSVSVVTLGHFQGHTVELANQALCKNCLAKAVGFDSWSELQKAKDMLAASEKERIDAMYRRGGPYDR